MKLATISSRWMRFLLIAIAAFAIACTASTFAPQRAEAIADPGALNPTPVSPGYEGWVTLMGGTYVSCGFPPSGTGWNGICRRRIDAYRWTGWTWTSSPLFTDVDQRVYAYPYTSGWHWVWTERTGWLAARSSNLRRDYSCTGPNCMMY